MDKIKAQIYNQFQDILEGKINVLIENLESAKESQKNDTKSSAGDKFETSREIIQIEINKLESQLNITRKLKSNLSKINIEKKYKKAEFGSLIITNKGNYFLSVSLGKLEINKQYYYAVSMLSPIGKVLVHKKLGDMFLFNNEEIKIINIL